MGTHATISVELADGSVNQIYVHYDGYESYTGKLLTEHYNSQELAEKLVALGNISVLQPRLEPVGEHSFDNPERGTVIAYTRDRGDKLRVNRFWDKEMWKLTLEKEEYNYIFTNGCWFELTTGPLDG